MILRQIAVVLTSISILAATAFGTSTVASADTKRCVHHYRHLDKATGVVTIECDTWVTVDKHKSSRGRVDPMNPTTPTVHTKSPKETYADQVAAIRKRNEQAREDYITAVKQRNDHYRTGECVYRAGGSFTGANCATPKRPKMIPIPKPPKGVPAPNLPPIPPKEAAYLAIATKLRINASGIGIGPDPDLSRWKMAVVGHSYWLWATGPTHLGPVSDSDSGRTVTLNATLTSVNFEMGDGGIVKCKGAGTPYPGDKKGLYAKSPTCGYTYQTTSKHHAGGTYPVRATTYWSVAYSAPDGSGVIPIVLASERDLKVGELQTVITH